MNFQNFIRKNLLKKENIGFDQIEKQIQRAYKDLKSAEVLLASDDAGAYQFAYNAMLHAGRALLFVKGYRPTVEKSHKTVVDCVKIILGERFQILIEKFDRMRKARHTIIYDISEISGTEARNALKSAGDFVGKIAEIIQKKSPQKKLF